MLFSGASDLLSQIVKPLLNSSNDFSPVVNFFQRPSYLCIFLTLLNSLLISLSLSFLLSSQLLPARVDSPHLSSTCPIFSQPSRSDTVTNFLVQPSWTAFPFDHGFNIRLCFQPRVMYYHSILLDCWLLPAGPTFKCSRCNVICQQSLANHNQNRKTLLKKKCHSSRLGAAIPHSDLRRLNCTTQQNCNTLL